MFTVKAEAGPTNYSIFSAERIRVSKYKGVSAPPGAPLPQAWSARN